MSFTSSTHILTNILLHIFPILNQKLLLLMLYPCNHWRNERINRLCYSSAKTTVKMFLQRYPYR